MVRHEVRWIRAPRHSVGGCTGGGDSVHVMALIGTDPDEVWRGAGREICGELFNWFDVLLANRVPGNVGIQLEWVVFYDIEPGAGRGVLSPRISDRRHALHVRGPRETLGLQLIHDVRPTKRLSGTVAM